MRPVVVLELKKSKKAVHWSEEMSGGRLLGG